MLLTRRWFLALSAVTLAGPVWAETTGPRGPFGRLVRDGQPEYALEADDALWAARMLTGEAGGEDDPGNVAVLWCMLNSYMIRDVRGAYPTFRAFIRAYCTPLQPFLKAQGAIDRHRRRGTPMVEVEPGKWQLQRHVDLQQRPWERLPAGARAVAERVLARGGASPCGNATQFCSTATYFHDEHGRRPDDAELEAYTREFATGKRWTWIPVTGADPRDNVFFAEDRFAALPANAVRVELPTRRR